MAMEHKVEMTAFRTQVTAIEGRLSTSECQAEGKALLGQQALMVTGTCARDRGLFLSSASLALTCCYPGC